MVGGNLSLNARRTSLANKNVGYAFFLCAFVKEGRV